MMPGIGMMSYDAWYWDDGVLAGPRAVVFRALTIIHLLCVSSLSSLRVRSSAVVISAHSHQQ